MKVGKVQWQPGYGAYVRQCKHCRTRGYWAASDHRGQAICTNCLEVLYVEPTKAQTTGGSE